MQWRLTKWMFFKAVDGVADTIEIVQFVLPFDIFGKNPLGKAPLNL